VYTDRRLPTKAELYNEFFERARERSGYAKFPLVRDVPVYVEDDYLASLDQKEWHALHMFCVSAFYPKKKAFLVTRHGMCRPVLKPIWCEDYSFGDYGLTIDVYRYRSAEDLRSLGEHERKRHPMANRYSSSAGLHSFGFGEDYNFADIIQPALDDFWELDLSGQKLETWDSELEMIIKGRLMTLGYAMISYTKNCIYCGTGKIEEVPGIMAVEAISPPSRV